jgi:phosphate uptake regulator
MTTRKIQLIAGSTYSITLPKNWVKKNGLKEKNEVSITEKNDRTLLVSPAEVSEPNRESISIKIEDYPNNIKQILFTLYYMGIENINLTTKKEIDQEKRAQIRKALTHMGGTEIIYEDHKKISIKCLLDRSKVNILQIVFRMSLIIEDSVNNLINKCDLNEIKINENELDRLYHLTAKIMTLSLINTDVLVSSKITNISTVPSYLLISKKLENIGDKVYHLCIYMNKSKTKQQKIKEILNEIIQEMNRSIRILIGNNIDVFEKGDEKKFLELKKTILHIDDRAIQDYLIDSLRYLINIEEEIVNISFIKQLISKEEI